MWKKEIIDTLKQTALILSFLLLIPVIFGINQLRLHENLPFIRYMTWGIIFVVPILIYYLAYTMFASEDRDNANEYLKSLPVSKWKLFSMKVLPRLFIAWLIIMTANEVIRSFWWSHGMSAFWLNTSIEGRLSNGFMPVIAMISGFFLGISHRKNPFLLLALAVPIVFLQLSASGSILTGKLLYLFYLNVMAINEMNIRLVFNLGRILAFTISVIIPSILPVLVLIPLYKLWDVSSAEIRSRKMLKRMAIPLGLIITLYAVSKMKLF